jgi:hypothetical protein
MPRSRKNPRRKKRAPPAYGDAPTPAQLRAQAEFDRQRQAHRRKLCNMFEFWSVCPHGQCQRRRSCVGDAEACFERRWWVVPEELKILLHAFAKARVAGMSFEDAHRAADEEVARSADHIARVDAATVARLEAGKAARHGT